MEDEITIILKWKTTRKWNLKVFKVLKDFHDWLYAHPEFALTPQLESIPKIEAELLTMKEAAIMLRLRARDSSLPAVFTRLGKRGLMSVKTGRERLYLREDIIRFMDTQKY